MLLSNSIWTDARKVQRGQKANKISLNVKLQVQFIFGQLIGKLTKPLKYQYHCLYGDTLQVR